MQTTAQNHSDDGWRCDGELANQKFLTREISGDIYVTLFGEVRRYRVWFGTAQEIVAWFRNKRALCFEEVQFAEEACA